jgi:hypothetical protein
MASEARFFDRDPERLARTSRAGSPARSPIRRVARLRIVERAPLG